MKFTVGQFRKMLEEHPEVENADELIAFYPEIPAEAIRAAWQEWQAMISRRLEIIHEAEKFIHEAEKELRDSLQIPEEKFEETDISRISEVIGIKQSLEDEYGIWLTGTPQVEKRKPGRPISKNRLAAYNFIRSGRMSQKQAFDWWLKQDDNDAPRGATQFEYEWELERFKEAYKKWLKRQKR